MLAARLTESGRYRVLLLEAGGTDRNPWIHIPMGYAKTFVDPRVNWKFESEPEIELNGRTMYQPRGKVLGGTSSINGMIYMRGNAADYDQWRQLGNEGWDYDSVLPYFRKAEDNERGADQFHGSGGPLRVSNQPYEWEVAKILLEACQQAGIPFNPDFNGARQEGCGYYQDHDQGQAPLEHRGSLSAHGETAREPDDQDQGACHPRAVRRPQGNRRRVQHAKGHRGRPCGAGGHCLRRRLWFATAAAAIRALDRRRHLTDNGIEVVHDMAGVGSNLQDHFNTFCTYRISKNLSLNALHYSLTHRLKAGAQYVFLRSGPMSGNGMYVGALVRSDNRLERPDLQFNISAWSTIDRTADAIISHPFPGNLDQPGPPGRQKDAAAVRLRSSDPLAPPEIRFNFLRNESDMRVMVAGVRIARSIAAQSALQTLLVEETAPGVATHTDDEIAADVRQRGVSNLHPVGTCGMGRGPMAVVDPRLRVHGMAGLRVVDASVMPVIVAGNTNAPTIMIAEKASDMIQQDAAAAA